MTLWIDTFRPPHGRSRFRTGPSDRDRAQHNRVVVRVAGRVVADTRAALTLSEANYAAVQYIPRKDVDMTLLERTDRATYCPYKGTAPITAFHSGQSARSTPCGAMKIPIRQ